MSEFNDFNIFHKLSKKFENLNDKEFSQLENISKYNCGSIFGSEDEDLDQTTDTLEHSEEPPKSGTETIFNERGKVTQISFYDKDGNYTGTDYYTYDDNDNVLERISVNANNVTTMRETSEFYDNNNKKHFSRTFYRDDGSIMDNVENTFYESGEKSSETNTKYYQNEEVKSFNEVSYREDGSKIENTYRYYNEQGKMTSNFHSYFDENDNEIKKEIYNSEDNLIELIETQYNSYDIPIFQSCIDYNDAGELENHFEIKCTDDGMLSDYIQYSQDGKISYRTHTDYNEDNYKIRETIYDGSDNIIQMTEHKYGNNYERIESVTYDSSGNISETTEYKQNTSGDLIGKITKNATGNIISESIITYGDDYTAHEYTNIYDDEGGLIFEFEYEYSNLWGYSYEDEIFIADKKSIYKNNKNDEIGYTIQGITGDCWLLSGINALSYSEKGQSILNNAVTDNGDGTYTISFKGVNTDITITEEEIQYARESSMYSEGDDDMLLLELGFESIINKISDGEISLPDSDNEFLTLSDTSDSFVSSLDGGYFEDVIFLLTGNDAKIIQYNDDNAQKKINNILDKFEENPESMAVSFGFMAKTANQHDILRDINGNYVYAISQTGHAFSLKSVNGDTLTIINPFDSSKEYVISRDSFKTLISDFQYYEY